MISDLFLKLITDITTGLLSFLPIPTESSFNFIDNAAIFVYYWRIVDNFFPITTLMTVLSFVLGINGIIYSYLIIAKFHKLIFGSRSNM